MATHYLACDLGAESGRLILGTLLEGRLSLEEIHRFPNTPIQTGGALHWNIPELMHQLKRGLREAADRHLTIASISTDSWGVDYMFLDAAGTLISPTFHYRDSRGIRGMEQVLARIERDQIFEETGIQFMPLNAIFQLATEPPERWKAAALVLGIADGFNYLLSGVARAEESLASTFQLYNPRTRNWSEALLNTLAFPRNAFPELVPAGTRLGPIRWELTREMGLSGVEVVATCSHDTGAAVAAVPADERTTWAYISSGTWSLMGVELRQPIFSEYCRELNFTNEIGYGGSVRFLKNIIGLWLVQECRREWALAGQEYDYATLTRLAGEAPPFVSLVDPTDPRFVSPGAMPEKIAAICRETSQPAPASPGATIRCALESLALLYGRTLRQIEVQIGKKVELIHIVGGGSRNALLNQFTASALGVPVLAGPVEATALGNVLVQAMAGGAIPSLSAGRALVRDSFAVERFEPKQQEQWRVAHERFEKLVK